MLAKEQRAISLAVVGLALPLIGQSLLQTLIVIIDRVMLGHYATEALASMRISGTLIWCISGVLSAFAVGSVALVGRAVGAGDRILAAAAARSSLLFALAVGTAASAVSLIVSIPDRDSYTSATPTLDTIPHSPSHGVLDPNENRYNNRVLTPSQTRSLVTYIFIATA